MYGYFVFSFSACSLHAPLIALKSLPVETTLGHVKNSSVLHFRQLNLLTGSLDICSPVMTIVEIIRIGLIYV